MEKKRKGRGFSLAEVLISISVISIGMLGAVGAIAFGLKAGERGSKGTFALQINQRIVEMILSGSPAACNTGGILNTSALPDNPINGVYNQPLDSNLWHPIMTYAANPGMYPVRGGQNTPPFDISDFVPSTRPAEQNNFVAIASSYQSNINISFVATTIAAPAAVTNMVRVQVSTRWADKTGWKCVTTNAYANGTKS